LEQKVYGQTLPLLTADVFYERPLTLFRMVQYIEKKINKNKKNS